MVILILWQIRMDLHWIPRDVIDRLTNFLSSSQESVLKIGVKLFPRIGLGIFQETIGTTSPQQFCTVMCFKKGFQFLHLNKSY